MVMIIILVVFIVLLFKFRPRVYFKEEGVFLQYTIRGALGFRETVIKKIM